FSGFFLIFFFQAEDGIRDFHVTGVQTCALPIFAGGSTLIAMLIAIPAAWSMAFSPTKRTKDVLLWMLSTKMMPPVGVLVPIYLRSEERRVGEECRCRAAQHKEEEKNERRSRRDK